MTLSLRRALLATALLPGLAPAQDGTLDTSFGTDGDGDTVVAFDFAPTNPIDTVLDTVVDSFGRIYLVGVVTTTDGPRIGIARLRENGTLDTNYGPDDVGLAVAPEQLGFTLTGASVATDALGNLLVAGTLSTNGNDDFAVCKFTNDGALTAFDNGFQCVKVAFDLGSTNDDVLQDMAVGNDGRIVLVGSATQANTLIYAAMARLEADGDIDNTFNGNGRLSIKGNYGHQRLALNGVKIQANGKIVAVGGADFDFDVALTTPVAVRVLASGAMDADFGLNGMARYTIQADDRSGRLQELALTPITGNLVLDQTFVAAGQLETAAGTDLYNGFVIASATDGSFDPSFNGNGQFIDTIGHTLSFTDIEREGDGAVMVVGTVSSSVNSSSGLDFYATRIERDGTRDVSGFNAPFGFEFIDFAFTGKNDSANAAVFQKDRLLIAGTSLRTLAVPPDLDFSVVALQRRVIFGDGLE
jgi:uncharacterized delta-60 repeat protein